MCSLSDILWSITYTIHMQKHTCGLRLNCKTSSLLKWTGVRCLLVPKCWFIMLPTVSAIASVHERTCRFWNSLENRMLPSRESSQETYFLNQLLYISSSPITWSSSFNFNFRKLSQLSRPRHQLLFFCSRESTPTFTIFLLLIAFKHTWSPLKLKHYLK